jgi:ATP-dependent protease ClpP protease subunit
MIVAVIDISDEIGIDAFDLFKSKLSQTPNYEKIIINIDSYGGYLLPAQNIYAFLEKEKQRGIKVKTIGWGMVFSAATMIFIAGQERVLYPFTKFLIHLPKAGNISGFSYTELKDYIVDMESDIENVISVYSNITKKTYEILLAEMALDKAWNAQKALDMGFATLIDESVMSHTNSQEKAPILMYAKELQATPMKFESKLSDNAGYKRSEMPQIDSEFETVILNYFLAKYGKRFIKPGTAKLADLKPAQNEIDKAKVQEKVLAGRWGARNYLVSSENYLLDGHHDWAAGLEVNENATVKTTQIKLPIRQLIDETNKLKVTYSEALSEDPQMTGKLFIEILKLNVKKMSKNVQIVSPTEWEKGKAMMLALTNSKYNVATLMSEKALKAYKAGELKDTFVKNMALQVEGTDTKVFVYSEDGTVEGKRVVVADAQGSPTETPAPDGSHILVDEAGKKISIKVEAGVVTEVSEEAPAGTQNAASGDDEKKQMSEFINTANAVLNSLSKENAELKNEVQTLKTQMNSFAEMKDGVTAMAKMLGEITSNGSIMSDDDFAYFNEDDSDKKALPLPEISNDKVNALVNRK